MADYPDLQYKRDFENAGRLTSQMPWEAVGSRTLTISGTVTSINHASWAWTGTMVADAQVAAMSCSQTGTSAGIMYHYDGATTPSQLSGHFVVDANVGQVRIYGTINIQRLEFVSEDGTPVALTITLER
jgi:hypothetical protein